jgi:hypothetical protein
MKAGAPRPPLSSRTAAPHLSPQAYQHNGHISAADPALEEDVRTKQALLTAIVALILFGAGFWLVQEFHRSIHVHECFEQGRRNCPAAEIKPR